MSYLFTSSALVLRPLPGSPLHLNQNLSSTFFNLDGFLPQSEAPGISLSSRNDPLDIFDNKLERVASRLLIPWPYLPRSDAINYHSARAIRHYESRVLMHHMFQEMRDLVLVSFVLKFLLSIHALEKGCLNCQKQSLYALMYQLNFLIFGYFNFKTEILTFDGNPLNYHLFMKTIENSVEKFTEDGDIRLKLLIQHCTGIAREAIKSCGMLNGMQGYEN